MQSNQSPTLMTADELLHMPDDGWKYELDRGELIRMSPSGSRSSRVSRRVGSKLDNYLDQNYVGTCGDADWGFRLASNPDLVRVPDIGFVRAERIPADGLPAGFWPGAPDLAIEVVSPTDRFANVLVKVREYLDAGTLLVWVIDPETRRAFIFRPGQEPEIVNADGELGGEDVVPGFVLRLADVWV
ncbi:MAG: Uma2 family endonuclease [Dehalococcoidia bacterium]